MKGIQLGALWFSQNGLQCWDHVCHKRHPSSIFGGASFPRKKCFNVEDVFAVGGWGPVDFHKNGPPYGNHMQDQSSKLWILQSTVFKRNHRNPCAGTLQNGSHPHDLRRLQIQICPNGDHIPKPEQDREMFEGWSMLLGATPQTSWDSAAYAQLPGPSHFVSCQRNSGLWQIRHGPAPHHRLKSAAGLVDEVDFKMFKAQNFWMSWLFTNPDMRDRLGYSC